jgi:hypothetical protein
MEDAGAKETMRKIAALYADMAQLALSKKP